MAKIFKLERRVMGVVRPMLTSLTSVPLPQDEYFQNLEDLHQKLAGIDKLLVDPKTTTVRLVTNPEKVVLKETQRAFTYFCLFGLTIDAVIVNRILPAEVQDRFFSTWRETQERWVHSLEEFFAPVPLWRVPLFQDEVLGTERLKKLGQVLYGARDPAKHFYDKAPYRFRKVDGNYHLCLRLPFVNSGDVDLHKKSDELVIRLGGFKRHVSLPQRMSGLEPLGARIKDGELVVVLGRHNAQSETSNKGSRPA
jgi:arsenite-transporting ATPase